MITAILRDGSHWRRTELPLLPPESQDLVLRLYRDGHVAGYVLSGIPKDEPGDYFPDLLRPLPWTLDTSDVPADALPAGVTAFLLSRDEHGRIDTANSFVIRNVS